VTHNFIRMVNDCLRFASQGLARSDYKNFCLRTLGPGAAYYDRLRALEWLIDEGAVLLEGERLEVGILKRQDWLIEGLAAGDIDAWEVVNRFPNRALKFNPNSEIRAEVGLRGELAVLEALRVALSADLAQKVTHVALFDDSAGYDIFAPSIKMDNSGTLLEVKTTSRPGGSHRFVLTQNEFQVGLRNPNWYLIFVQILSDEVTIRGFLTASEIAEILPVSNDKRARWLDVEVFLDESDFSSGLP